MPEDGTTEPGTESTETPAPKTFDESYVGNLRRESAGYRTRAKDAEDRVSALEAELAEAKTSAPALESRATTAETQVAKLTVALEKGLPLDLVGRLVGSTAEELAADADALLSLVTPKAPDPLPNYGGGSTEQPPASPNASFSDAIRRLANG